PTAMKRSPPIACSASLSASTVSSKKAARRTPVFRVPNNPSPKSLGSKQYTGITFPPCSAARSNTSLSWIRKSFLSQAKIVFPLILRSCKRCVAKLHKYRLLMHEKGHILCPDTNIDNKSTIVSPCQICPRRRSGGRTPGQVFNNSLNLFVLNLY